MAEAGSDTTGSTPKPYRVLARKYRPADFSALIGQEPMVRTLTNAFASGRIAQAWMLTGVRGVGKTTTARILARALNYKTAEKNAPSVDLSVPGEHCKAIMEGRHVDVVEMDAASHTGIDDIREIIEQVRYAPVSARFKVFIIDEVHMLSTQAFNGLLKTLEEPPPHVKFIFATTEIRKVPITVLSRCQRFDLRRVEAATLVSHLAGIAEAEKISVEAEALAMVARAAEGSVRDALSILDQAIAHGAGAVSAEAVRTMLGLADRARVVDLFEHLMRGDIASALAGFRNQYDAGADPVAVLSDLAEFTHLVTRFRFVPGAENDPSLSPDERQRGGAFAKSLSMAVLSRAWQMLLKGISETQTASRPASAAEMVLIRIAHAAHLPTLDEALSGLKEGGALPVSPAPRPAANFAPGASARPAPIDARGMGGVSASPAGATMRLAAETAPALRTVPQSPPQEAEAGPAVRSLLDIVALAEANRDMAFKILVKRCVRPVKIEPGKLEVSLTPDAPATLATDLSNRLKKWTNRPWLVSVSRAEGARTLAEEEAGRRADALTDARNDPAVAEILQRFPGAKIIDVRIPEVATETGDDGALPEPGESPISSEPDED